MACEFFCRVRNMVLLARLHVDALLVETTAKKVKATFASLSKGSAALNGVYNDAMQRVGSQLNGHYELAKKALSWITYVKRPLTIAEICCVLVVEPEDGKLDPEGVHDIEDLISVCAGLVVVNRESAVVHLVHYTMQEYVESIRATRNPSAQLHIGSTCLTCLLCDKFKMGKCMSDKEFEDRLRECKFLDYAARYWGEHAIIVEDEVCALVYSFLQNRKLVSSATQVFLVPLYKYLGYSQNYPPDSIGLYPAARFGLTVIMEVILPSRVQERVIVLEKRVGYDQTLLNLAAKAEHD